MENSSSVVLDTESGRLFGTLLCPQTIHKVPVVLIIAGSGPTNRDGNSSSPLVSFKTNALKLLAEALAQMGIASVRYDKRAIGESAAASRSESELRFEHYVQDAVGWITKLKRDPRFSKVGVMGHSEGAMIGLMAGASASVSMIVSLCGPGRRVSDLLREQRRGWPDGPLLQRHEEILLALEGGRMVPDVPNELAALFRPSVQPYLMSWLVIDPATEIAKVTCPVLVVHGATDIQVSFVDALRLTQANVNAQLAVVEGMNHILKSVPNDRPQQIASYSDVGLPLAPELVLVLSAFVEKSLKP
jgi:uncharacterized protein